MLLHPVKTKFWKNINLNVKIGKTAIKIINSNKYLEIIIANNLNWSEVQNIYKL